MRRPAARTLLVPFLALLLALLAAPPGTAHPGAAPVNHAEAPGAAPSAPRYAGYLFAYFTGEGTADGEQIRYALSRGDNALSWRELNGGQPVLTSTTGEKGLRDPFVIRSPRATGSSSSPPISGCTGTAAAAGTRSSGTAASRSWCGSPPTW